MNVYGIWLQRAINSGCLFLFKPLLYLIPHHRTLTESCSRQQQLSNLCDGFKPQPWHFSVKSSGQFSIHCNQPTNQQLARLSMRFGQLPTTSKLQLTAGSGPWKDKNPDLQMLDHNFHLFWSSDQQHLGLQLKLRDLFETRHYKSAHIHGMCDFSIQV